MYDEFDDREERNEQGINGGMEPEIPEAEEPIEESDFHAEESDGIMIAFAVNSCKIHIR